MTATLSAARSFTSEPYFSAAQELDSQGRLISQASEDVSNVRASVNDSWQGNAASAFAAKTKSVEKSGEQLSKNLSLHAQLLSWYAGAKSRACRSAVAVADNAKAKGFDVSDTWKLCLSAQQLAGNNVGFQVFEMAVFQISDRRPRQSHCAGGFSGNHGTEWRCVKFCNFAWQFY